jgi:hypothetical protein
LVQLKGAVKIQVQGFADASEMTYRAGVYLRSVNHQWAVKSCSHSTFAPVKKVTFPRLELFGVVLLAEQVNKVIPLLNVEIQCPSLD